MLLLKRKVVHIITCKDIARRSPYQNRGECVGIFKQLFGTISPGVATTTRGKNQRWIEISSDKLCCRRCRSWWVYMGAGDERGRGGSGTGRSAAGSWFLSLLP